MRNITLAALAATTALVATPAFAVQIPDGDASVSGLFTPTVDTASSPNTFTPGPGPILFGGLNSFIVSASGGLAGGNGQLGNLNGTLQFSSTKNDTIAQSLTDFFVFTNANGGTYNFSVSSVKTQDYTVNAASSSIALYLLGTTVANGFEATPTSLTLSFNRTGTSPYSASATLAIPPANTGTVPEPASWAMMVGGFGVMGAAVRRRKRVAVTFG